ncbi:MULTISPECIES: hypothetical protein [Streptomyces]|uniref:hypothetical protein n=1 Tax=Streptomyces TaxID=1883 RepID=UPI0036B83DCE
MTLRVFARQDTPERTRAAIHAQILSYVPPPDWLANHQDLDDDALERETMGEIARAELRALSLSWVTADPLTCVDSPYVCFRASAAMADDLPAPVVARLLDDEESSVRTTMVAVRRATAARPRLPAEDLTRLLADPSESVATAAAGNPDLPSADMHRILALAGL